MWNERDKEIEIYSSEDLTITYLLDAMELLQELIEFNLNTVGLPKGFKERALQLSDNLKNYIFEEEYNER